MARAIIPNSDLSNEIKARIKVLFVCPVAGCGKRAVGSEVNIPECCGLPMQPVASVRQDLESIFPDGVHALERIEGLENELWPEAFINKFLEGK
jgi:hypothetical protein